MLVVEDLTGKRLLSPSSKYAVRAEKHVRVFGSQNTDDGIAEKTIKATPDNMVKKVFCIYFVTITRFVNKMKREQVSL